MDHPKSRLHNPKSGNKHLHKWHAVLVLILSCIFYLLFFAQFNQYNHTHGGGQPTLPGMEVVVLLILVIITLIVCTYQLLLYRQIRKKASMSLANIAIALPLIIFIPLSLQLMELPDKYCWIAFANLMLSGLLFYFTIKSGNTLWISLASVHAAVTFLLCLYWLQLSDANARWWDNGNVIRYYDNGNRQDEAENKKEGIIYGKFIQWNYDGTLAAFDRYPNGHNQPSDSSVKYFSDGQPMEIKYLFDSAAVKYERIMAYNSEGFLFFYRTTNTQTHLWTSADYYPDTKSMRLYEVNFDSSGTPYKRQLQFSKTGLQKLILVNQKTNQAYVQKTGAQ